MDWILDNLEYIITSIILGVGAGFTKILHGRRKKPVKNCPNLKIIENDLINLQKQVDDFEKSIKTLIAKELEHSTTVHKLLFEKIDEVSSKIDYTRGQVDQHLRS